MLSTSALIRECLSYMHAGTFPRISQAEISPMGNKTRVRRVTRIGLWYYSGVAAPNRRGGMVRRSRFGGGLVGFYVMGAPIFYTYLIFTGFRNIQLEWPIARQGNPAVMKKSEKILRMPGYCEQMQTIVRKKIGAPQVPMTSNIDMGDISDGRISRLLDYLSTVSDGERETPTHIVYVVKNGATSTGSGWICEYYNKAKCVDLSDPPCAGEEEVDADKIQTKPRPPRQTRPFGHKSNQ